MIKIKLISTANRMPATLVPEESTIREFFEQNDISYEMAAVYLDGVTMQPGDLDKTFEEWGIKESCRISVVIKTQAALEATVAGNSLVITSSAKLDDLKLIQRLRPNALTLHDEDNEPIFGVTVSTKSAGHLNKNGATFGSRANANGNATITMMLDADVENVAQHVEEKYGCALLMLRELEEGWNEHLLSIRGDQEDVKNMIKIL